MSTAFRRKPLTVSRPFHLAAYFEPVESRSEIESFFLRFRQEVYEQLDRNKSPMADPRVLRESGLLPEGRRYFFCSLLVRDVG